MRARLAKCVARPGWVFLLIVVIFVLFYVVAATLMLRAYVQEIEPELVSKAESIGSAVAAELAQAVDMDIPFDQLPGIQALLVDVFIETPEVAAVVMTDNDGLVKYQAGSIPVGGTSVSVPISSRFGNIGKIQIILNPVFVSHQFSLSMYSVIFLVPFIVTIAIQLLLLVMLGLFYRPEAMIGRLSAKLRAGDLRWRLPSDGSLKMWRMVSREWNGAGRRLSEGWRLLRANEIGLIGKAESSSDEVKLRNSINNLQYRFRFIQEGAAPVISREIPKSIQAPVFLFVLAEHMNISFMPQMFERFIKSPNSYSFQLFFSALPILLFMISFGVTAIIFTRMCVKMKLISTFYFGAFFGIIGYILQSFSDDVIIFLFSRILVGICYGTLFVSSKSYATADHGIHGEERSVAIFLISAFLASSSGAILGGILYDLVGVHTVFLGSALLCVISVLLVLLLIGRDALVTASPSWNVNKTNFLQIIRNRELSALFFLIAFPEKIVLTGVIFYLIPVYLDAQGLTAGEIGQTLMIYGLLISSFYLVVSYTADRWGLHRVLIVAGGIIAGLGLASFFIFGENAEGLPAVNINLVVLAIGVGHTLLLAPRAALVTITGERHPSTPGTSVSLLGAYRVMDLLGMIGGPLIAAALAIAFGLVSAMAILGIMTGACCVLYTVIVHE